MPGPCGCGGIPQARAQSARALSLAQELAHPYTLARALYYDTLLYQLRRDAPAVRDQADAAITVATAQEICPRAGPGAHHAWLGYSRAGAQY